MAVRIPQPLAATFAQPDLLREWDAGADRVGLAGPLGDRGHRAHRTTVPGSAAVDGYRFRLIDTFSPRWWPQGVSVGEHEGVPLALVSWFAQPRRGQELGSRITVVDLSDPDRARYHHVLLVAPRRTGSGLELDPVTVHAGGIAWHDDELVVAATLGGIRTFRLSDITRLPGRGRHGYRWVLPETARYAPPKGPKGGKLRYSFLSLAGSSAGALELVGGEYGKADTGRLARLRLAGGAVTVEDVHVPGIAEMQGAAVIGDRWFVSASRGDKHGGDLWTGEPGAMTRHPNVLPPGPEDLAAWPGRDQLWSVTEFPGKRWLFTVDTTRLQSM
jgi:hypothetical protein